MAKIHNYQCDGCNEVLYGKDRAAIIKDQSYMTFKGRISMQMMDKETGHRFWFYTGWDDSEFAFHLPTERTCIQDFVERELMLHENRRKASLMDEVGRHGGSDFVPRPAPAYRTPARPATTAPAPAPKHFGFGGIAN